MSFCCWLQNADIGQVAIALGVVEAVSNDESVRALKAHVLAIDFGLLGVLLLQKRRNGDRCGIARLKHAKQVLQREARIDNIFRDNHVAAFDVRCEVFQNAHDAGAFRARSVRRHGHVVHLERKIDLTREVGHVNGSATKHAHHENRGVAVRRFLVCHIAIIFGNLLADLRHSLVNRLFAIENFFDIGVTKRDA